MAHARQIFCCLGPARYPQTPTPKVGLDSRYHTKPVLNEQVHRTEYLMAHARQIFSCTGPARHPKTSHKWPSSRHHFKPILSEQVQQTEHKIAHFPSSDTSRTKEAFIYLQAAILPQHFTERVK